LRSPSLLLRDHAVLIRVSPGYPPLKGRSLRIPHPSATRYCYLVRLACVRHTASVQSEPGSNSPINLMLTGMPQIAFAIQGHRAINYSLLTNLMLRNAFGLHQSTRKHPQKSLVVLLKIRLQTFAFRVRSSAGRRIIGPF
jgi:hypothetical protein